MQWSYLGVICILTILLLFTQNDFQITSRITEDTISNITSRIDVLENNNIYLRDTISNLTEDKSTLMSTIEQKTNFIEQQNMSINSMQNQIDNLSTLVSLYQNGTSYSLHNPSYSEALSFIQHDFTDSYTYQERVFECDEFAEMFNNNAESIGIRCGYVVIEFNEYAHALNAFDTLDRGIIYIEPQSDDILLHLNLGDNYWFDCFEDGAHASYDDEIVSINVIW